MASSSTLPFSCPKIRPTSPPRSSASGAETGPAVDGAIAGAVASAATGASSMIASTPCSIFEEDLNSRSLSFWKNAIASPCPRNPLPVNRAEARCKPPASAG